MGEQKRDVNETRNQRMTDRTNERITNYWDTEREIIKIKVGGGRGRGGGMEFFYLLGTANRLISNRNDFWVFFGVWFFVGLAVKYLLWYSLSLFSV